MAATDEVSRIDLNGTSLHRITERQCVEIVADALMSGVGGWIVTINLHHLRLFSEDPAYADLCAGATLRLADGMPLVWASRLRGTPLPERIAGVDLVRSLSAAAADMNRGVFLLGGDFGTAEATAAKLRQHDSRLRIVGTACPAHGFLRRPAERDALVRRVCETAPDLVFVALGKQAQDELIAEMRPLLPRAWFVGVGISFSFYAGAVRRAPRWMQLMGLEWLHRVVQEPGRLGRRYVALAPVGARLLLSALRRSAFIARDRS